MSLGRSLHTIASGAARASFDVLEQGHQAMPLEGQSEIGEHGSLDGDWQGRGHCAVRPVDDQRAAAGEGEAERFTGGKDQPAVDHCDERRFDRRGLHRFGQRRGKLRVVAHRGQSLREALEQGNVGAHQENRRHVAFSSA